MKLLPFIFLIFAFSAQADRLMTRIHSIDLSQEAGEPHLIKFENGRVGFLSPVEKSFLSSLQESQRKGEWLDVELDEEGNFLGAGVVAPPVKDKEEEPVDPGPQSYTPTNLNSLQEATAIFNRMNRRHQKESQCYNRAHVWAYEEWKRTNLQSVKLFMFFTRSYIRQYRYGWWFHVTPMTYVNHVPMTMDRTFMRGPAEIRTWTDKFIISKRNCPIITKYSEYRDHQESEHCYLHPATMYYWQPRDLENNERTGYEKKQFITSEVNWAYREAF